MNRRLLSAITILIGLIVIALAVCSATVWRPSSTAQARMAAPTELPYVVTEPGVLGLVDSEVTVTATAATDENVIIVVARSSDMQAWLADDPYTSISGLSGWDTLSSTDVTERCDQDGASVATSKDTATAEADASASATPEAGDTSASSASATCTALTSSGADPAASDLWLKTQTGTGSTSLTLDATNPDLVVLAATTGADAAPELALSWPRSVSTPWLIPGLVLGGLLLLVGVFVLLIDIQMRHADSQRRARAAERAARIAAADGVATASLPMLDDPDRPLTRREKRDKERAERTGEEWVDPRTGKVYYGGVEAPTIPGAPAGPEGSGVPEASAALESSDAVDAAEVDAVDAVDMAGTARGSAVVPGLSAQAAAAYRAGREPEEEDAYIPAAMDDDQGWPAAGEGRPWSGVTDDREQPTVADHQGWPAAGEGRPWSEVTGERWRTQPRTWDLYGADQNDDDNEEHA